MKRMMFLVVAVLAGAAVAQDAAANAPVVNLDKQALNVTGNGSLLIGNGELVPVGTLRATVAVQYASQLAITRRLVRADTVATDRMYAQIGAAYGLAKQWDAAVYVPILLAQQEGYSGTTFGSPIVSVRAGIADGMFDYVPLNVSFEAGALLELGEPIQDATALTTTHDPRPHPIFRLTAGKSFGTINVFGEVNFVEGTDSAVYLVRMESRDKVSDQLGTGLGLSANIGEGLWLELSGTTAYDLKYPGITVQTMVAARFASGGWGGFVGFGPAFGDLIGTPNWRLIGGIQAGFDGLSLPGGK